ncbi:MAG: hypothetical protein IPO78_08715 [Saprospiraceae bacterium]|nr:hypothetical protein [Saprospiraceae bacterium]
MLENVRLRSANNDFFLESTGSQNVVCFVSDPFDVSSQGGKTIELNAIYEGTSVDGFTSVNVNISYRYNNDAWVQLLNQNSNFIRVVDTAILLIAKVPNAVANLDGIVDFLFHQIQLKIYYLYNLKVKIPLMGTCKLEILMVKLF